MSLHKTNLSTTTSITTSYAGEFAGKYIAAALLSAPTLDKGGITIMPNVKFRQVIKRVGTDGIIKNATCDFDPTSTITLTERILQPESFQINLQFVQVRFSKSTGMQFRWVTLHLTLFLSLSLTS
jgi:hypothetical protein